jgi:hypothetical protein
MYIYILNFYKKLKNVMIMACTMYNRLKKRKNYLYLICMNPIFCWYVKKLFLPSHTKKERNGSKRLDMH